MPLEPISNSRPESLLPPQGAHPLTRDALDSTELPPVRELRATWRTRLGTALRSARESLLPAQAKTRKRFAYTLSTLALTGLAGVAAEPIADYLHTLPKSTIHQVTKAMPAKRETTPDTAKTTLRATHQTPAEVLAMPEGKERRFLERAYRLVQFRVEHLVSQEIDIITQQAAACRAAEAGTLEVNKGLGLDAEIAEITTQAEICDTLEQGKPLSPKSEYSQIQAKIDRITTTDWQQIFGIVYKTAKAINASPYELLGQMYAESRMYQDLVSSAGAHGIWQIKKVVAEDRGFDFERVKRDSVVNTQLWAKQMTWLHRYTSQELDGKLIGYNCGPGCAERYAKLSDETAKYRWIIPEFGKLIAERDPELLRQAVFHGGLRNRASKEAPASYWRNPIYVAASSESED